MVVLTFPREADMTNRLLHRADDLGCGGWHAFTEFEAPQGIPDVVFAQFSADACAARQGTAFEGAFTDRREAAVLLALDESHAFPLSEVASRARLADSTARAALTDLARRGAVERIGGNWTRSGECPSRLLAATAIELKLSDWRRALDQACRYRLFAERSLVVVAAAHTKAAAAQTAAFRLNGVGLAGLSPWGSLDFICRVRTKAPIDALSRFLAGERLWAARGEATVLGSPALAA